MKIFQYVYQRFQNGIQCFQERRTPSFVSKIIDWFWVCELRFKVRHHPLKDQTAHNNTKPTRKNLYASPVGRDGKDYLEKIIRKFGYEDFDYLIFVWDDVRFDEPIFSKCKFVFEKGLKWYFMKKYVTPQYVKNYEYIFAWDDDVDVAEFSHQSFIDVMKEYRIEVAQPALIGGNVLHEITRRRESNKLRFVDFVEIMVPVFSAEAWSRWWYMMEPDCNFWGYGYDDFARSFCGYKTMAVIDSQPVTHCRPVKSFMTTAAAEGLKFKQKMFFLKPARRVSYQRIKK